MKPYPKNGKVVRFTRDQKRVDRKAPKKRARKPLRSPYLHPAWIALRRKVIKRSKGVCEACRSNPGRHVHHLAYGRGRGWRRLIVPLKWLLHVCIECHNAAHPLTLKGNLLKRPSDGIPDFLSSTW